MKKVRSSKRVSSLCVDLKSQMEGFDHIQGKPDEEAIAKEKRRVLYASLKEKIKTLSR